jgi:hypothetical protein
MSGYTLDWTGQDLYGSAVRLYHLSDIADGRTTIATGVTGLAAFGVLELEGAIVPASIGAGVGSQNTTSAELPFTVDAAGAVGFCILKVNGVASLGGGGWTRVSDPANNDFNPVYYSADLGAAGAKNTNGITFPGGSTGNSVNVMAYASAGPAPGLTALRRFNGTSWGGVLNHRAGSDWVQSVLKTHLGGQWIG